LTSLSARETVQFIQQEIPNFISPDLWPPKRLALNPVDYRIWGLIQECSYIVQYTCKQHQWLKTAPHWRMGKHITKYHRRSSWLMEKVVTCKHGGQRTSLWI